MKAIKILFTFTFLIFYSSLIIGQNWLWAKEAVPNNSVSGGDVEGDHTIAIDASGNAYMTSWFEDTISFGAFSITTNSEFSWGGCLVKFDANGNVIWAKQPIASNMYGQCYTMSVALDRQCNPYLVGSFYDTMNFASIQLRAEGYAQNPFIAKYDSAGNVLWAKQAILASQSCKGNVYGVAVDSEGNSYIVGTFHDTLTFGAFTLKNKNSEFFLVKYDPRGNVLWAKQDSSSPSSEGEAYSIAVDNSGGVYLTGYFTDTITFGIYRLVSTNFGTTFIAKYDTAGNLLWAKQAIKGGYYSSGVANSISIDGSGDIYVAGAFEDTLIFGGSTIISQTNYDAFLVKYDPNGNVIWASKVNDTGECIAYSVVCDSLSKGGAI